MKVLIAWEKQGDGWVPIRIESSIKTMVDLKAYMGLAKLNKWEITAVEIDPPKE